MFRATPAARVAFFGLTLAGLAAGAPSALAQDVEVTVLAIRATKSNNDVSPELRDIAAQLRKQFQYTGFKLEQRRAGRTALEKVHTATLIGPYSAEITPTAASERTVQLKCQLLRRDADGKKTAVLRSTVTVEKGRYQLFGGPSLGDGDVLIMAVTGK
ncbi:MAG: hypothetical protein LC135_08185 [Phycisphaerae bacterium]|nr:hypothetical protein [Phycisphaerae bacterium]MCZ2399830.1 hypothetical protein [Phycisphaerae bacterium]